MNECQERTMVFGLETEYAAVPVTERSPAETMRRDLYELGRMVADQARFLGIPHFCNTMQGIMTAREHELVEKLIDLWLRQPARRPEFQSLWEACWNPLRQRMGQTGTMLSNGSRLYLDMTHPEYSTPEVASPRDLVIAQKAGDRIMEACRLRAEEELRKRLDSFVSLRLFRNNTDYKGNSFAGHENYLVSPELFCQLTEWQNEGAAVLFASFLATRQVITGAGKAGDDCGHGAFYQISQRADFIETMKNNSTMKCRPIINTRDIPYGDPLLMRRLHIISGDSSMSELSIFLKFGMTALVLAMMERGALNEEEIMPLAHPVDAFHAVSRDLSLKEPLLLEDGTSATACEYQRGFLEKAKRFAAAERLPDVWGEVIILWEGALDGLFGNRHEHPVSRNLDWVIKEWLFAREEKKRSGRPFHESCADLDLAYHDTNPDFSVYDMLLRNGFLMAIAYEEEIKRATAYPPRDTRAWLRGTLIRLFSDTELKGAGWEFASFGKAMIQMRHPSYGTKDDVGEAFLGAGNSEEALSRIQSISDAKGLSFALAVTD